MCSVSLFIWKCRRLLNKICMEIGVFPVPGHCLPFNFSEQISLKPQEFYKMRMWSKKKGADWCSG